MQNKSNWTIRAAAKADLSEIWQRGVDNWGIEQVDRYIDGLFALFDLLADFPELSRLSSEFAPPVRIHPSGAHLVVYVLEGQGIQIVRVLHAHQNLMAYLQEA